MHDSRQAYQQFHAKRHAALCDLIHRNLDAAPERCLDVGGGGDIGGLGAAVRDRYGCELHALEAPSDVDEGRSQGVCAVACDIDREPFPYPAAAFDLALFTSVIEHLYNPAHTLAEIARVLKPGGLLILEAPNAVALGRRLDALFGRNPFAQFNAYNAGRNKAFIELCSVFYTAEECAAFLEPAYTVLERGYAMHDPPVGPVKALVRRAASAFFPRTSDCFYLAARKR